MSLIGSTVVETNHSDINRKHGLIDMMFLVISAIMSAAGTIETYGNEMTDWLCEFCPLVNSSHAVGRIFSLSTFNQ